MMSFAILLTVISYAIVGYIIGSIPFGLVLTKIFGFGDIRKVGSGNIGATNVLRATGRKDLTILTILLDAFKAAIAFLIAKYTIGTPEVPLITGFAAIIGHNFPIWLKFKGGKGVASAFGLILVATPMVALCALITWIVVAVVSKYSSLSAICAAALVPVYAYFFVDIEYVVFYIPIVVLVLVRHHANFVRLFKGEESKITFKKKS